MFYRIDYSLQGKEIGKFPQVSEGIYPIHVSDPRFIENICFSFIDFTPEVPGLKLAGRAKLTDLLSSGIMGTALRLVVSSRFRKVLEDNEVKGVQFFETYVINRNERVGGYYILHPYLFQMEVIDFARSVIWVTGSGHVKIREVQPQTLEEFQGFQEQLRLPERLYIDKLAVKEGVDINFFVLSGVGGGKGYYVSEHLKQQIEAAGCTGVVFEPVES